MNCTFKSFLVLLLLAGSLRAQSELGRHLSERIAASDWIKTVAVNSSRLAEFWGRDVQLEACVLLPAGDGWLLSERLRALVQPGRIHRLR